jgi:ATP-dependent DNA helicase 2 subunit 2
MNESEDLAALAAAARKKTKQVAKCKVDLQVTPNMRIGVAIYIKSKIVNLPAVKKRDASNNAPVRIDRAYVKIENPDVAVEDKITALRYGGEYVATPPQDLEGMKLGNQSKCLEVMGFFDKSIFGIHRLISNADCLAAEPNNVHAAIALSSLIHACLETGKVALCRLSVREGSEPKLVVLFPHAEYDFECFYSIQAPFAEDSRENTLLFPSLPRPSNELLSTIDSYIDSHMLFDEKTGQELLVPEQIINPTIHRFWKTVAMRLELGNDQLEVPPVDPQVERQLHPERFAFDEMETKQISDRILQLVTLEEVDEKEKHTRKTKYWRDDIATGNKLVSSPSGAINVKRIRIETSPERRFFEQQQAAPSKNPIRDFIDFMRIEDSLSTAVSSQTSQVSSVVHEMEIAITALIQEGAISKAVESIASLRSGCIEENQPALFNEYLRSLLGETERHPRLWRELIGRGVMLISSDESKYVKDVSQDQARDFFESAMRLV